MRRFAFAAAFVGFLSVLTSLARAEGEGQADLDAATDLQVGAESLADLEKVSDLIESALKKGLDKGQQDFARRMLAATLYQHADRLSKAIFEQKPPTRNWQLVRQHALKDLEKAKQNDPNLPDAYLLLTRLHAELPGGDEKIAKQSIEQAVKLLKDNPKQQAAAYVLRGKIVEGLDEKLENFEAACRADPDNLEALQARAVVYLQKEDTEKAMADFAKIIDKDPTNSQTIAVVVAILVEKKKFDEAMKYADKLIERKPDEGAGYRIKGSLLFFKDEDKAALEQVNKALDKDPNDAESLLLRAQVYSALKENDKAKADIEKAMRIDPDSPRGILMRSMVAAQQKRFAEAIADIKLLLQVDPTDVNLRLQLASYYVADKRPRKAIEMMSAILADEEKNADVLRARGDALLSVGRHADAIADYDKALSIAPEDTGVLNNLAWVLATSPEDNLRNAKRSIELATKACELTKYDKPHILSTLASGYAEMGDWDTAIKWSSKAVEGGSDEPETAEQLKKELESYKQKKPWREKQEIEENTKPLEPGKDDLET
ncbi:MAG TPA: tetratricopeptide repeat protein [Pirellulaceae bacterium]|nr:tetratricopeptide repeat protein [Pirellulaceae bacterium]